MKRMIESCQFVTLLGAVISAIACTASTAAKKPPITRLEGVDVAFERKGLAPDYWSQRFSEPEANGRDATGDDYWFQLRNDSGRIIRFETASIYLSDVSEWPQLPDGRRMSALRSGLAVFIVYGLETRRGRPMPWGSDMRFMSTLLPGRSVSFSIPKKAFERGQRVFIEYQVVDPESWREVDPIYREYLSEPMEPASPEASRSDDP